jgi:hypothetical protein
MIIDGVFKSQPEQIEEYQNLLKTKIRRDMNGGTVNNETTVSFVFGTLLVHVVILLKTI